MIWECPDITFLVHVIVLFSFWRSLNRHRNEYILCMISLGVFIWRNLPLSPKMASVFILEIILLLTCLSGVTAGHFGKPTADYALGFLMTCEERQCPRSIVDLVISCTDRCDAVLSPSQLTGGSCWWCQCPIILNNESSANSTTPISTMYTMSQRTTPEGVLTCVHRWP